VFFELLLIYFHPTKEDKFSRFVHVKTLTRKNAVVKSTLKAPIAFEVKAWLCVKIRSLYSLP